MPAKLVNECDEKGIAIGAAYEPPPGYTEKDPLRPGYRGPDIEIEVEADCPEDTSSVSTGSWESDDDDDDTESLAETGPNWSGGYIRCSDQPHVL